MFRLARSAASPLRSVALRYQHALVRRCADRHPRRPWDVGESHPELPRAGAATPCRRDEKLARVEALLFVAREPQTSRKIAQLASLADGTEARTLIRRLNHFYDSQASAFRVEQVAGGYQILTRPKFGGWLRRLHPSAVETRLSAPALETLAVVAYRQPVVRAEVESIRGVQCGEILRQLIERDLVRIAGRSDELGRPFLYGTTRRFLLWLGLRSLDDLPRAATLRRADETSESFSELTPAVGRDNELTPRNDLNEESEVKKVVTPESEQSEANEREPWKLAAATGLLSPRAAADEEDDVEDEDEELDDDDDDLDDDEDDDLDDEEDLEDEDLEDEEWEEVDDEDDDWEDEEDDDWDEDDDEEEEEDEDWEDE